jgi:transcriptional regulator with GAF, ATPase, and Fis domain
MGGTDAFIFTLNAKGQPEICVSSSEADKQERFSDTVIQEVLKLDEGIAIPNALSSRQFSTSQSIIDLRLVSVMCCPIKVAARTIGVLYLGTRKPMESFSDSDLRVLNLYATVAGMLINHVDYISHQNNAIRQLTHYQQRDGVIGESKKIQDILQRIDTVADADITVLLEGETGTGKDVFAHYLHNKSGRRAKPMVVVNCSSLQGELLESELFGHKRGSFTGAQTDHEGLFAAADGGTLFLDEIGEMSEGLQAKLLRTIETGKIRPVGATSERKVNVRIICATNRDLTTMVSQGTFRKDLYYRINQFSLRLPPLREREGDAVLLAYFFLEKYKCEYPAKNIVDFHPDSLRFITVYEWPGNVRELAAVIHRAVLSANGPFVTVDIGEKITEDFNFELATRNFQKRLLEAALMAAGNNREQAAKLLGMTRSTFFRYLAALKE